MEGNDYLCRSWFKLLIRGSFPSIIAEAVFAKGRLFLRLSVKTFPPYKVPTKHKRAQQAQNFTKISPKLCGLQHPLLKVCALYISPLWCGLMNARERGRWYLRECRAMPQ